MKKCYICNKGGGIEWYSLWWDGKQREICSMACRATLEDLGRKNPEKTYSQSLTSGLTGRKKIGLVIH